ncbi:MAG TPA: ABC transporter permease [Verrucomicrobiae bacterium]|nr:ABC transporter permease [Verrucomicrobiae bacterium]
MKAARTFTRRFRALWQSRAVKQEIDEELRFHLEQRTAANIAAGMSPKEAARAARKQFGNVQSIREECRETRGATFGEETLQDIRFGLRMLRKNPGFTTVAVLTLGLGIGVNTSMFSGLQSLLLPELPFPEPDGLVRVFRTSSHSQRWPHSPANFLDQQQQNTVFERMAAVNVTSCNLSGAEQPAERLRVLEASTDLIPLLGIQPVFGRAFLPEEDRPGSDVIILNHGFWLRHFSGDTNVLGRILRLNGHAVTVVGVMPASFQSAPEWGSVDALRPIAFSDDQRQNRGGNYLDVVARVKPGLSLAAARAGTETLAARLRQDHPDHNDGIGLRVVSLAQSRMDPRGKIMLWLIMGLAGFVLLIACANLANLQFARTALRTRELAIRGAMGAPRGRLLRQLLTESLLIAALGGVLGLVLSSWVNQVLSSQLVENGKPLLSLKLNFLVLGFALAVSTLTGLAFGLVPAWLASRNDVNTALKQGSRGATGDRSQHRLRHGLIVLQMALALMLLAGAGLVVSGLKNFGMQDPGWRVDGLSSGQLSLPDYKYGNNKLRHAFTERLQERLAALPGVEGAAVAVTLPISGFRMTTDLNVEGQSETARRNLRNINVVSPGYFATLGMRLLDGRDFNAIDTEGRPHVIIVNETLARTYWPGESAVGKRIGSPDAWQEIVGVVNDVRSPTDAGEPGTRFQTYRPLAQEPQNSLTIAVRGNVSAATLRKAVAELDPDLPLSQAGTVRAVVTQTFGQFAVGGWLLAGFAGLGLLLAAIGIYGVMAGFVTQRTNEIGVRMALGAQVHDVLRLVLGRGVKLTLVGTAFGLVGAVGMTRTLKSLMPGLNSDSPLVLGLVAALLIVVALVACWLPARRAAKVDPMVALRTE